MGDNTVRQVGPLAAAQRTETLGPDRPVEFVDHAAGKRPHSVIWFDIAPRPERCPLGRGEIRRVGAGSAPLRVIKPAFEKG